MASKKPGSILCGYLARADGSHELTHALDLLREDIPGAKTA